MTLLRGFLDSVCTMLFHVQLVFLICVTLLVFSIASVLVVEPDTATYVISVINVVTLVVLCGIFGSITWLCNNRKPAPR